MTELEVGKTVEDYLEAVLMVKERQGYVRSVDVAEQLEVTKPSVSYAVKRLREAGYLTMDHANMLVLTDAGFEIADRTYTKHKELTNFFISLGVDPKQARIDACKVEHDISDETFQAIVRHEQETKRQRETAASDGSRA